MTIKKICPKCKIEKDIDGFCGDKYSKDKHQGICKVCDSKKGSDLRKLQRQIVIGFYTKGQFKCDICPENRLAVLDLDHKEGDGCQERKEKKTSQKIYSDIIKNKFPNKYRVLCRNCNWIEWCKRLEANKQGLKT